MLIRFRFSHLLDGLWLFALCAYLALGFAYIDFHGDETNHIFMTRDYVTAFVEGQPYRLSDITDENGELWSFYHELRLIDAPLHGYIMGFAWHLARLTQDDLPRGAWRWSVDVGTNIAEGRIPSEAMLFNARAVSTFLLCLSVMVMFGFGMLFGGRPMAYFVSGLYAFNPLILMHGRRAMHEAPLLLFGLLTLMFAALITRHKYPLLWLGLIVCGGLTMASKHTGLVYVIGALAWIVVSTLLKARVTARHGELVRTLPLRTAFTILHVTVSGLLMLVIFITLSPSLWRNPIEKLQLLVEERGSTTTAQNYLYIGKTDTLLQRGTLLIEMPFMTPLDEWWHREFVPMLENYRSSIWSGVHVGRLGGLLLTVLAAYGIIAALIPRLRPANPLYIGLVAAALPVVAMLLLNRLPWQRHYVTVIPFAALFAGIAVQSIIYLTRTLTIRSSALAPETP